MPANESEGQALARSTTPSRFPLIAGLGIAMVTTVIGALARTAGVPWLAIVLSALVVGGITAWSVLTDPDLRTPKPGAEQGLGQ